MRARWIVWLLPLIASGCDSCGEGKYAVEASFRLPAPKDCTTPPADAEQIQGLKFVVVHPGEGDYRARGADTVHATINGWTAGGTHFLAMPDRPLAPAGAVGIGGPMALAAAATALMTEGEKRRFWGDTRAMNADQVPGLNWPEGKVCIEMEITAINRDLTEQAVPELPVELRAPPADALTTVFGVRYVFLTKGEGKKKPAADDLTEFVASAWYLGGHLKGQQLARNRLLHSSPVDAPGKATGALLMLMAEGDKVRAWLPAGQGVPAQRGPAEVPMVAELKLVRVF